MYIHIFTYIYIYVYTCIYIYIHIYIYIQCNHSDTSAGVAEDSTNSIPSDGVLAPCMFAYI